MLLAVFDAGGQRLFDEGKPLTDELFEHLRDSILKHPFYGAGGALGDMRMALASINDPSGRALRIGRTAICMTPRYWWVPAMWDDLPIFLAISFGCRGMHPSVSLMSRVSDELMGNLLRNLLRAAHTATPGRAPDSPRRLPDRR